MKHEKTRLMDIYAHLRDNEIDVYTPAQHTGECTAPYVVVKDSGTDQYNNFSSTRTLYDIMCYIPKNQFTYLEQYVDKVKTIMEGLKPMIMPMHYETPSFYDDTVKAHMISIQYRNYKKFY